MINTVEISSENAEPPSSDAHIHEYCVAVMDELGAEGWELSVLFCDDHRIAELNKHYRHKEGPTDVLSFPQIDEAPRKNAETIYLGDVVISVDSLRKNAREYGSSDVAELARLLVHGILHLAGYDHDGNDPDQEMLIVQERILASLREEILT